MNKNIVYDGTGTVDNKNLIRYFLVLPLENPEDDYDFQVYNFSSTLPRPYNRLLIHMKPKVSGSGSNDLSNPAHWPQHKLYLPMIERTLANLPNATNPTHDGTQFSISRPMEVILYHNDTLDSEIWAYYTSDIPIILPKKVGFGTLQKI